MLIIYSPADAWGKGKEAALMAPQEVVVCILVAIEPQMYREVLASHFHQERPLSEVVLASSQALQSEAERTKPHLIFATEIPPELKEEGSSFFWVELRASDVLVATISADGYSDTVRDVSLQDLIAVVDKAEEELAQNEAS
jgi:hypothetical protein